MSQTDVNLTLTANTQMWHWKVSLGHDWGHYWHHSTTTDKGIHFLITLANLIVPILVLSKVSFALCETGKSMYVQRKVSFNVFMIHIPKTVCTTGNSTIWNNRTLPGQMHLKGVQKILFTSNLYMENKIGSA